MNDWQSTCLGRGSLPRDLSAFEIEAFFTFSDAERRVIEERRHFRPRPQKKTHALHPSLQQVAPDGEMEIRRSLATHQVPATSFVCGISIARRLDLAPRLTLYCCYPSCVQRARSRARRSDSSPSRSERYERTRHETEFKALQGLPRRSNPDIANSFMELRLRYYNRPHC